MNGLRIFRFILLAGIIMTGSLLAAQSVREIRYSPDHGDFVITNGAHRFNRALYGSHTGFRVEAGDRPEFGLYMPRLGGTLRLGLICGDQSKWLIDADTVEARYNSGSMRYRITDALLGDGTLELKLLALADTDGMILKVNAKGVPEDTRLFWAFGGASDRRFSRDGDLGADPESVFDLTTENCRNNTFYLKEQGFRVYYESQKNINPATIARGYAFSPEEREAPELKNRKCILGIVPNGSTIGLADAENQEDPLSFLAGTVGDAPAVCGQFQALEEQSHYVLLANPRTVSGSVNTDLARQFNAAEKARHELANHFRINTPDEYINAAGGALAAAADGIWDGRSFMHGAIAWRMPLNGWRGAYAADWLGWPERAESHFRGYFTAQYTEPPTGPSVPDPKTHLARQKEVAGTTLFSDGYISRSPGKLNKPHHYDMNLVFISQLLWHVQWTGDTNFINESWPVLERHLAWEKRNFDANDDGLYDAYCCIWASDALQYSGGGVTHSSAYNYRANRLAAELAPLAGKDPTPYEAEAQKIKQAVNANLWLADRGWFAEYKDSLGLQRVHPSAAVWTLYHAIDEGLADPFQAWQSTQYIDHHIPHIPITGAGMPDGEFYTISTTDWMPYTWSINNVALAEVLHTALAYWQTGRSREAFALTKGSLLDYMFMGSSPGNFGQLSYYDAFRGELYRDFADPIGMAARVFVEGLFGFKPNLLKNEIQLRPGWPTDWEFAELETSYLKMAFHKDGTTDRYTLENRLGKDLRLRLELPCLGKRIGVVRVNGVAVNYSYDDAAIGQPVAMVLTEPAECYRIDVEWSPASVSSFNYNPTYTVGDSIELKAGDFQILELYDPQQVLKNPRQETTYLQADLKGETGGRTFFVKLQQKNAMWWQPVSFELHPKVESSTLDGVAILNPETCEPVLLDRYFNDSVTNIFKEQYRSPRSSNPTLSIPVQGIGDWCSYRESADIDDRGIRRMAQEKGTLISPQGIPFRTPAGDGNNILFTSQWDVYPEAAEVPLQGRASHVYLLMAGSVHHMQIHMLNGEVEVCYADGSSDTLELRSPNNWWPIEQDYYEDGLAFKLLGPRPPRLYLKTGKWTMESDPVRAKNHTLRIDGGAATLLALPLDPEKELKCLRLRTLSNDIVMGLMAVTLQRD